MLTRAKTIAFCVLLTGVGTSTSFAQQRVRGEMPEGAFVIDPKKVSSWNQKKFATAAKQFSAKKLEALDLERWNHEFPASHSGVTQKAFDAGAVELPKWKVEKAGKLDLEKRVETKQAVFSTKSKSSGPIVTNEKWARSGKKAEVVEVEKKIEQPASDFIVQATIRPLEVPELQEKLNEYSSPPGERKKQLPSQLQKSSKF